MRNPYNCATTVMTDYADRIMYGGEDEDEALQNAIDWTFRDQSDEWRADMWARLCDGVWDDIPLRFVRLEALIHTMLEAPNV